jgi:hypothetical protein
VVEKTGFDDWVCVLANPQTLRDAGVDLKPFSGKGVFIAHQLSHCTISPLLKLCHKKQLFK